MFGLSWGQLGIIALIGIFVLGPERIPTAVASALVGLRKLRELTASTQSDLLGQVGPEIAELRRQIAELQTLAGVEELRSLRDLHPQKMMTKTLFEAPPPLSAGLEEPVPGSPPRL